MALRKLACALYRAIAFLVARRVVVSGWSMYPTLASGEYVLCDRLAYLRRGPGTGDVVLLSRLIASQGPLVKRVLAVPGDTVSLAGGRILVNGAIVLEGDEEMRQDRQWVLQQDEYFVTGDALDMSTDSRAFGPVPRKAIRARAWLVYWPPSHWRRVRRWGEYGGTLGKVPPGPFKL